MSNVPNHFSVMYFMRKPIADVSPSCGCSSDASFVSSVGYSSLFVDFSAVSA